jgi:hypothetical protein
MASKKLEDDDDENNGDQAISEFFFSPISVLIE